MLGRMVLARFTIQPVGDEVHTSIKAGDKMWRKKYGSISDATTEAIELRMMEEQTRPFAEGVLGQSRSVDAVLFESLRPFEVDLDEIRRRGFWVDS
jgi:hypothetical protein